MDRQAYLDEIKLKLTGGVLDLELDDVALNSVLDAALRELQRYIFVLRTVTLPYKECMDLSELNINTIVNVFRAESYQSVNSLSTAGTIADPMYAMQWQLLSVSGNMYNFQDYMYNLSSWNTMLQVRNTLSTDLAYQYYEPNLYVNISQGLPEKLTIQYIPRIKDVEEIKSDFWTDVLVRLAVGIAKETLGRVRSKYTQSNAVWSLDGERLLEEGRAELAELRERLNANDNVVMAID